MNQCRAAAAIPSYTLKQWAFKDMTASIFNVYGLMLMMITLMMDDDHADDG